MISTLVEDIERNQLLLDLKATKTLLEQGWCQHAFHSVIAKNEIDEIKFKDQYCIRGAMNRVVTGAALATLRTEFQLKRLHNMKNLLLNLIPSSCGGLALFNDEKGRTQQDVLNLFDKAIEVVKAC